MYTLFPFQRNIDSTLSNIYQDFNSLKYPNSIQTEDLEDVSKI